MAAPTYDDLHDDVVERALFELRQHRKARRLGDWHFFDALYKAYLSALAGGLGITMLSGVVGDERIGEAATADVRRVGPALLGVLIALVVAFGLRSGSRGGPIALEAAEVRYVLLAPVDRNVALRQPARRQLRFSVFAGSVIGAVIGLLAFRRFAGPPLEWIACGAVVGTATALAMTGAAMLASGRRVGKGLASLLGVPLLVWSLVDALLGSVTSPTSFLGQVALWPLDRRPVSALVLGLPVVIAGVGLSSVGGLSLEAAERRGRLVSGLRFAATFQDLRTVMLLRRQLSSELPRSRPWIALRPAKRGPTIWRRDWRGILRWPAVRVVRLVVMGVLVGLSTAAAWAGTTPMILVAAAAMFVAALDAVEGLAQEIDHPDRRDSLPIPTGALHLRHLAAPAVVMLGVGVVAVASAAAVSGSGLALQVGLPILLPGAAIGAGAGAISLLRQPPDAATLMQRASTETMPGSAGIGLVIHHSIAPAFASLGPAATLLVKAQMERDPGAAAVGFAATAGLNLSIIAMLVFGWVRHRKGLMGFLAGQGTKDVGK